MELDAETGLYYYGKRYYDPKVRKYTFLLSMNTVIFRSSLKTSFLELVLLVFSKFKNI